MSRSGIQLCVPFEEKRLLKWQPPFIVQPKLDGDRMRAIIWPEWTQLLSSEENEMNSALPHIADYLYRAGLRDSNLQYMELDGEAYTHGMNHELVHGIASRRTNPHERLEDLEYWVFDVVENIPMHQRIDLLLKLNEIFKQVLGPVHIVPFRVAENLDDVMHAYDEFVGLGYEGIIVRDHKAGYVRKRSTRIMKFKPKKDDHYIICGYSIEVDQYKQMKYGILGRFICAGPETESRWIGEYPPLMKPPEGFFAVSASRKGATGTKIEEQMDLWRRREELRFKVLHVEYQHTTPGKGVPRFPVFCEIIWDLTQGENNV